MKPVITFRPIPEAGLIEGRWASEFGDSEPVLWTVLQWRAVLDKGSVLWALYRLAERELERRIVA